jgi:hypothetical protein
MEKTDNQKIEKMEVVTVGWVCDMCKKEFAGIDLPEDWFELRVYLNFSGERDADHFDFCSLECVASYMKKFGHFLDASTAEETILYMKSKGVGKFIDKLKTDKEVK